MADESKPAAEEQPGFPGDCAGCHWAEVESYLSQFDAAVVVSGSGTVEGT